MATKMTTTGDQESPYCAGVSCADEVRLAVAALSGRWAVVVLESLYFAGGSSRYRDLQRRIGAISQKELSRQLTHLVEHAVVRRVVHEDRSALIVYELTEGGTALLRHMQALGEWAKDAYVGRSSSCDLAQPSEGCRQQRAASWMDPLSGAPGGR